ncbi:MAG TPA: transglycosylase family protein [Solirubrobacterales bacterium]|nr:transglycosylase family protein [Solirubrobacterales bacterium]
MEGAITATVPRLLIKRTHILPTLLIGLACPAAALAATGSEDGDSGDDGGVAVDRARVAEIAPLQRPVDRFHWVIDTVTDRLRAEQRAEARRERRELFATLPGGVSMATLESIASCESGGDPTIVSADGSYRGKYQFSFGTWESVGGSGDPAAAPEREQDYRAALLYAQAGSSPWPVCG